MTVSQALSFLLASIMTLGNVTWAQSNIVETTPYTSSSDIPEAESAARATPEVKIEVFNEDGVTVRSVLEEVQRRSPGATVVFSSDENEALREGAAEGELANRNRTRPNFFLLPFGNAVRKNQQGGFNNFIRRISGAQDRRGVQEAGMQLVVMTMVLGTEVVQWVHAGHAGAYSDLEVKANIIYSLATSLYFGLDPDRWSESHRVIQRGIRRVLGMSTHIPDDRSFADSLLKYVAASTLAASINLARVPLLNIDEIAAHSFDPVRSISTAVGTAFFATLGSVFWYETVARIDANTHPVSKFVTNRILNARVLLMSMLASSAMLFDAHHANANPMITLGISAVGGLGLYLGSKRLSQWFENTEAARAVRGLLERWRYVTPNARLCRAIL